MARHNEFAGRTSQAWQRRYRTRRELAEKRAERLGGVVIAAAVGGPGVPGRMANRFDIKLPDGEVLTRRQAWRRLQELGL